jgi:dephospho-CoA kinase
MIRFAFCLILAMAQGVAFAASQPTPVNTHIQRTPMDMLTIRLRQQNIQIQRDVKAGKLTKDQSKTLKAQVEAIRKQEVADLKTNNSKTLTDAQITQLNEQLNTLSKSIPIR